MRSILVHSICLFFFTSHQALAFLEPDWDNNYDFMSCFINLRYKPVAINIDTKCVQKISIPTPMQISATLLDNPILVNTGQSVQTTNNMENLANATGGLLQGTFIRLGWAYYWTKKPSDTNVGTTINGKGFPLEIRVLWRNKKYNTIAEAVKHTDGLMELLFVFKICSAKNEAFDSLFETMKRIECAGWFTKVPTYVLVDSINFMSQDTEYYTYLGSYIDTETKKKYKCSRVIFAKPNAHSCISSQQFTETFCHLKNFLGQSYKNVLPHDSGFTQVFLTKGIDQNLATCT